VSGGGGNARDSTSTNAACRYEVGQRGKHSLQLLHSLAAISGMKLISFLVPRSMNPTACFFATSAQYLTHRPQWTRNEASFSKRSASAPYSWASSCSAGETPEQLAAFRENPAQSLLPENERELVSFVVRSIREPEETTAEDVQRLRDLGWSDADVFDATFMGAFMLASGVLFTTFKMNED
jgi:hypothetical protein